MPSAREGESPLPQVRNTLLTIRHTALPACIFPRARLPRSVHHTLLILNVMLIWMMIPMVMHCQCPLLHQGHCGCWQIHCPQKEWDHRPGGRRVPPCRWLQLSGRLWGMESLKKSGITGRRSVPPCRWSQVLRRQWGMMSLKRSRITGWGDGVSHCASGRSFQGTLTRAPLAHYHTAGSSG